MVDGGLGSTLDIGEVPTVSDNGWFTPSGINIWWLILGPDWAREFSLVDSVVKLNFRSVYGPVIGGPMHCIGYFYE